ncbi:MAG: DUF2958 domain-containing protein [Rhodospirillaceae bacterium]|nr:DUF2958 domain-containing protein [Rhodospirillaceae bacterium]
MATTTIKTVRTRSVLHTRRLKPAEFLPRSIHTRLLAHGKAGHACDHIPAVKFFDPGGESTWLLTEIRPDDPDIAYGLIHDSRIEKGPTLGYVSLAYLKAGHGRLANPIERDTYFAPRHALSVYFTAARLIGHVSEDIELLYLVAVGLGAMPQKTSPAHTAAKRR